jgi:hypothetical protein
VLSFLLTWYSSLTSEVRTITLRDVEPFLVCSDKGSVQIDLSWISLPIYEGIFLPQKELETLTRTNPHPDKSIKTLTQEDSKEGSNLGFQHSKVDDLQIT